MARLGAALIFSMFVAGAIFGMPALLSLDITSMPNFPKWLIFLVLYLLWCTFSIVVTDMIVKTVDSVFH